MTVVGLHPEDLFDKLLDGELSSAERERLRQHLLVCDVCRFEHAARLDFQAEALTFAAGPPAALSLRPTTAGASEKATAPPAVKTRPRRGRRLVWGLAAAALISASGAVAAGVSGAPAWHTLGTLFSEPAPAKALPAPRATTPVRKAEPPAPATTSAAPALPQVEVAPLPSSSPVRQAEPTRGVAKHLRPSAAPVEAAPAPAAGKAPPTPEPAAKEPSSAAKLFGEANQARRSGDIGRASGLYHLLQDQYPGSPEAELSRVTLALLLLDSGDAQAALVGFERYLAGSSRGLEAEALVGRARALGRLGRRDLELTAWQEVQRKYPHSIYGRQATERLSALGQP
jgi:TolA-binding protein